MSYHWYWGVLLQEEPGGTGTYLRYLLVGLGWTLVTALAAWALALVIGSVVGTLRTTQHPWVVRLGNGYVELFRNVPLLVQMFLWFFVVPELLPTGIGDAIKQMPPPWGSYVPAVLCLGLFTSVRVAEQVKAGIQSLPRGQRMAGTAMGLTAWQTYRYVILPQSFRIILPPILNDLVAMIKDTSLVYVIGVRELTAVALGVGKARLMVPQMLVVAAAFYLVVSLAADALGRRLETRLRRRGTPKAPIDPSQLY